MYLRRYHDYERSLADDLLARATNVAEPVDGAVLRSGLERLFPENARSALQRIGALLGVLRRFSVISGGPGTGKTFTVAKILILLQEQARAAKREPYRILLLAPTGKAAQRLGDAIRENLAQLELDVELRAAIPNSASTLHRALGFQPSRPTRFRHDRQHPLPYDVVVVDEASMVDLALMAKLVARFGPRRGWCCSETRINSLRSKPAPSRDIYAHQAAGFPRLRRARPSRAATSWRRRDRREPACTTAGAPTHGHRFTDDGGIADLRRR